MCAADVLKRGSELGMPVESKGRKGFGRRWDVFSDCDATASQTLCGSRLCRLFWRGIPVVDSRRPTRLSTCESGRCPSLLDAPSAVAAGRCRRGSSTDAIEAA